MKIFDLEIIDQFLERDHFLSASTVGLYQRDFLITNFPHLNLTSSDIELVKESIEE